MFSNLETVQNSIVANVNKIVTNISEYLKMKENGYDSAFTEQRNEDIMHEYHRRETYFEKQYELLKRCEMVMECQQKIEKLFDEFKFTCEVFVLDSQSTREKVGNLMNKELDKMRVIEKDIKKTIFTEEFQQENYTDYTVETNLFRKKRQIQEDSIRKQNE